MDHRTVVSRYVSVDVPLVVPAAYAEQLAVGPWDVSPVVGDPPEGTLRSVRVCQLPAGAPVDRLVPELERPGNDILVLLLRVEPADVPVGALLHEVLRHGYRVVEAAPVTSRLGRSVLVVTRDPDVATSAYLNGERLTGPAALRRLEAEALVEGMVIRAQRVLEVARLASVTTDLESVRSQHAESLARAAAAERRADALETELSRLRGSLPSMRVGRARARLVRVIRTLTDDRTHGPGRLARATARRLSGR